MSRHPQPSDSHGSLKNIQMLVNRCSRLFYRRIRDVLPDMKSESIEWVSPLESDDFSEYRDEQFLSRLGLQSLKVPLRKFWPRNGPQWDALGRSKQGEVFLVEAKANLPELVTDPTGAEGKSLELIRDSLCETKKFLGIRPGKKDVEWCGKFYQYTNRIAHLYFLRRMNKIRAFLVSVYFVGDVSVSGPKTVEEWKAALTIIKSYLGLRKKDRLSRYRAEVFIDVRDLRM